MRAKKQKPKERLYMWRMSLIRGTPQRYLGRVEAPDEQSAIEAAAKEFRISDSLRNRIVAVRDDY